MNPSNRVDNVVLMASADNEESVLKLNTALEAHIKDGMVIDHEEIKGNVLYIRLCRPFEGVIV